MRFGERGAFNMTVGKLIIIVLLVVIMSLILFGIQKGFFPNIERIKGMYDEVLVGLKSWGTDEVSFECYEDPVDSYVGGEALLEKLGIGSSGVLLGRCGPVCNMTIGGSLLHRISGGVDENFVNGEWKVRNDLFSGDVAGIKKNWELYHGVLGVLEGSDVGIEFLAGVEDTKKFVLYGDGSTTRAVWQNNAWVVYEEDESRGKGTFYQGGDDYLAIDVFYNAVSSFINDDNVYWVVLDSKEGLREGTAVVYSVDLGWFQSPLYYKYEDGWKWTPDDRLKWYDVADATASEGEYKGEERTMEHDALIRDISGKGEIEGVEFMKSHADKYLGGDFSQSDNGEIISMLIGGDGELDSDEKVEKLRVEFYRMKTMLLKELDVSSEEIEELRSEIKGSSFSIGEETFELDVLEVPGGFVISFGSDNIWLKYSPHGKTKNEFSSVPLVDSPFVLVTFDGVWIDAGDENYYKLPEEEFEEVRKASLISEFLKSKCR